MNAVCTCDNRYARIKAFLYVLFISRHFLATVRQYDIEFKHECKHHFKNETTWYTK